MNKYCGVAVLIACLIGCVNQQKEVNTYRRVLDEQAPQADIEFEPDQALSLQQAMLLTNQHNEQLAIKGEDYLQALIDKDRAFSAFLPTFSLGPVYVRQDRFNTLPIIGQPSQTHHWDIPVTGQINVFNGFRDVANFRRAEAGIDQQRELLLDLQAALLLETGQTYYQVIRSEHVVEVLKNSVAVQEDRVRDIKERQKVGLARVLDVSQSEAQASGTRVSLIRAQTDVRNGRSLLAFLIGQVRVDGPLTDQFDTPPILPSESIYENQAAENRRDLRAAQARIQAAYENLQSAIRQYFPSVTLNATYFAHREVLPRDMDWTAILQGNVPIFTGGLIEANIRTAYSQLRQAKLAESFLRRQVNQQVQVAYEDILASRRRIKELRIELKAAEEAYRQATESYKVGLATNLDQLIAQDRLLLAQVQLTSEKYNEKIFFLNLLRVTGRLTFVSPTSITTTSRPASQPSTTQSAVINHKVK